MSSTIVKIPVEFTQREFTYFSTHLPSYSRVLPAGGGTLAIQSPAYVNPYLLNSIKILNHKFSSTSIPLVTLEFVPHTD
jgi:hypothetical protein